MEARHRQTGTIKMASVTKLDSRQFSWLNLTSDRWEAESPPVNFSRQHVPRTIDLPLPASPPALPNWFAVRLLSLLAFFHSAFPFTFALSPTVAVRLPTWNPPPSTPIIPPWDVTVSRTAIFPLLFLSASSYLRISDQCLSTVAHTTFDCIRLPFSNSLRNETWILYRANEQVTLTLDSGGRRWFSINGWFEC